MAITINLSFGEWSSIFGDAKMTTALLDRLTHRCHIVETGNESWRVKHSSSTAATRPKPLIPRKRPTKRIKPNRLTQAPWGSL